MISIQKEIRSGEGLQRLLEQVVQCYQSAVSDARQYAMDFGAITVPYQAQLSDILSALEKECLDEKTLSQHQNNLKAAFRSFKDKAEKQLHRLRAELDQTATSLTAVLKAMEYDVPATSLRIQVNQLSELQKVDDIRQLKSALQAALVQLEKGLDETEKRNRMVISDLQAEVSVLHSRVVVMAEQKVGERGLRSILDERLSGESFAMLVARLTGLGRVKAKHGEAGVAVVMEAVQQRLARAASPTLAVGLWDEQTAGVLVNSLEGGAAALTRSATNALSGRYEVFGEAVNLQASAGVVEWRPPDDRAQFLRRLQDMLHVLRT